MKFRAWNKTEKMMDTEFAIHADGAIYQDARETYNTPNQEIESNYDDLVPMQYTSLKDKTSKDLDWWEYDILENDAARWLIIFEDGCFCVEMIGRFLIDDFFKKTGYTTEIPKSEKHIALRALNGAKKVGNKFENPELLEKSHHE